MFLRKPPATEALASVARHFQYAMEQSASVDEAISKLRAASGPGREAALQEFAELAQIRGPAATAGPSSTRRASATLAWLLEQGAAAPASVAALLREFGRHEAFSATAVVAVWSEFAGFLTYLGAVLSVLVIVDLVYAAFILPAFLRLYRGFGEDVPIVTSLVFGPGAPLALLATAGLLGFFAWFVFRLRRQLRRYAPLPAGYRRMPLVGPVARAYETYLWLSYAGLLVATGATPDTALQQAATGLPSPDLQSWRPIHEGTARAAAADSPAVAGDLGTAARLGRLGDELQFQREATVDGFLEALALCRRRARVILTILVYALVAMCVTAMYLPIFSLGSTI
jgi:hypothetical protein